MGSADSASRLFILNISHHQRGEDRSLRSSVLWVPLLK